MENLFSDKGNELAKQGVKGGDYFFQPSGFSNPNWIWLKAAAPSIFSGMALIIIGSLAAWNVHQQQLGTSELITQEMKELVAVEKLHIVLRELRYTMNLYLRTNDPTYLEQSKTLRREAEDGVKNAVRLVATEQEREILHKVERGFTTFSDEFKEVTKDIVENRVAEHLTPIIGQKVTLLADNMLTTMVLAPLEDSIRANGVAAQNSIEQSRETTRLLSVGFVLLGGCGGFAGLFFGIAFARGMYRSIVQLNVSVQGVAGLLTGQQTPITFTQYGDLPQLKTSLVQLESDIERVVQQLQKQEIELLRSEQLANVGQLAAGMAHELRNPLMPMKMLVQSALQKDPEPKLSAQALKILDAEISRLESSIQGFLDYARPPAPEKREVDISKLLNELKLFFHAKAELHNVVISVENCQQPFCAKIDPNQIRQLIVNLVVNGLEAMPAGGTLTMRLNPVATLESATGEAKARAISSANPDRDAIQLWDDAKQSPSLPSFSIEVLDEGSGIPQELIDRVFEPFVTSKESGTGLGLSICRRIANAHGGKLSVVNRNPIGTQFTLTLPRSSQ